MYEREADRVAASRVSPALKRFGEIARVVPGAERVRVRKRLSTGQIGPIGEWSLRDIQTSGDLESFLMQYVRPKWKGGEYFLAVIDGNGREHDAGQIPLPEPPTDLMGGPSDSGHLDLVRDLVGRMERNMNQQPVQPDPFEQIKKAKALMSELSGGNGNGGSSDAMAALLLAMQQQQRPVGPDPTMVQLLERLAAKVDKLEQSGAGLAALPPPMPPPPAFDMSALTQLLGTVAVPLLMKVLDKNDDKDRLSARDLIEIMDRRNAPKGDDDRFTARDAISLMREIQSGTQQQSLRDKLEEMSAIRELAFSITGAGGGAGAQNTTFWDALAALASNKGLADGIGRMLGGEIQQRRPAQTQVHTLGAPPPQRALPPQAGPQRPPQPAAPQQPEESRIMLPDDFSEYMKKVAEAQTDEQRIMAVIETLNRLRSMPQWSEFVSAMLGGAAQNEREKVLRGLERWLDMLVRNQMLAAEAARATMESFTKEWEAIHATIAKLVGAEVQRMEGKAEEAAPAGEPAQVVEPAPAGDESDEEDESEGA